MRSLWVFKEDAFILPFLIFFQPCTSLSLSTLSESILAFETLSTAAFIV